MVPKNGSLRTQAADDARPAATLVIMREAGTGFEVLLTRRPRHMRFMAGASVFPGGAIAPADRDPRWADASALSPAAAGEELGEEPRDPLAAYVAAMREAFEEVGFIAGRGPLDRLARARADDPAAFLDGCLELGIVLATDEMVPVGRWVTPLGAPIRFDTYFFLIAAPPGWEPDPDPHEVDGCRWITPAAALDELATGAITMGPPTVELLQRLNAHGSITETFTALRESRIGLSDVFTMRLSPLVTIVLTPNPSVMTGPGTNTYVVGTGPTAVIDPGMDDEAYLDVVTKAAGDVAVILVTHRHPDHIGGVAALHQTTGAPVRAFGSEAIAGIAVVPIADDETVWVGGAELRALHTPGHASDHLCFLLEDAAILFAGDNVLGEGTAVIAPPDGDMADYLESLERLSRLQIDRIFTGHWRPLDGGRAVIEGYIAHRRAREGRILEALGPEPAELDAIVAHAYSDTPEHLHPIAAYSARAHLDMLEKEGRVTRMNESWSISRR